MTKLEVSARMTIRKGKLKGFKQQAAEIVRQTKQKDTKTLRYDWFLNADETECEVREAHEGSEGLIEHRMHIGEALNKLFRDFAANPGVARQSYAAKDPGGAPTSPRAATQNLLRMDDEPCEPATIVATMGDSGETIRTRTLAEPVVSREFTFLPAP